MTGKSGKDAGPGNEDLKARMKEALERKQAHHHATEQAVGVDPEQKMHGVQGHVDTQNYRRKSGGGGA